MLGLSPRQNEEGRKVFCMRCGREIPDEAKFCPACGAPIEDMPALKKLEEPLEPLGAGAVPMVPIAPPPRATRVTPRAARSHAARPSSHPGTSSSGSSRRRSPSSRHGEQDATELVRNLFADETPAAEVASESAQEPKPAPAPEAAAAPAASSVEPQSAADPTPEPAFEPEPVPAPEPTPEPVPEPDDEGVEATESWATEPPAPQGYQPASARAERRLRRRVFVGVTAVAVVLAATFLVYVSRSWFGPLASDDEDAPVVEAPSDGSIEPIQADEDDAEDSALPEGAPEVRDAVDDYSWEELSQIATFIAEADSDDDAMDLAIEYNLCSSDGTLDGTQTKELELTDGTTVTMRVIGFRQDERSDGTGVAGITFAAENSVSSQPMSDNAQMGSGWEDSSLRAWMNDELLAEIPEDLATHLVQVDKTTNPVAGTGTSQVVTADTLWVLSYSEIVGQLTTGTSRYGSYTSEGEQYQLFSDLGVVSGASVPYLGLSSGEYWWERSPDVTNSSWFMCVSPDGVTGYGNRPATPNAVLMCFCL